MHLLFTIDSINPNTILLNICLTNVTLNSFTGSDHQAEKVKELRMVTKLPQRSATSTGALETPTPGGLKMEMGHSGCF